ncbi:MAG: ATP-binding protein [Acidimicrobiales bacterium]|nr:ATP-binding protein [Acidimicrobiales bacterium]
MKIRIRTKLATALAVPLVALVAISGYEAVEASNEADEVRSETELASVSIGPSSLTTELQNERNYTALDLIGLADSATLEVSSVAEARERVDASIDDLRQFLDGRGDVISSAFAPAFEVLGAQLEESRATWDNYDGPKDLSNQPLADEVFEDYTTMTQAFFDVTQTVATEIDDNSLRNGSEIVDQSNRRGELQARVTRAIVLDTLTEGNEEQHRADVAGMQAQIVAIEERINQLSVGPYRDVAAETLGRPFEVEAVGYVEDYLAGEEVDLNALLAAVSAGGAEDVSSSADMAAGILGDEADRLTAQADTREQQFLALAGAVVALAILFSWLVSRSITRPLQSLRTQADHMAKERLPKALREISETPMGEDVRVPELEPIAVRTRDEVGDVVEVLNDVQDRTLNLAADQAVLRRNIADSFVNLGRRNQNLLDRQLEFITELEQSETEPEELESLFRLDHLATRMRRNAESLLVLAGVEGTRQWSAPVSVDDVVRAALGEVEDYQRISVRHLDEVSIAGEAAAGVSHVLAELMENALQFSPPHVAVEIKGRSNPDGYLIAIDDDGIGMTPESLEQANRRLSGAESYTVAPSRYLGHYVAGNLAERLGVGVALQDSPAGGVTAIVRVPKSLVVDAAGDQEPPRNEAPAAAAPLDQEPDEFGLEPTSATVVPWADEESTGPAEAPSTLDEALGRPTLDSIETVDDLSVAMEQPREDASPDALPRRVPGAQRPDEAPTVARPPVDRTDAGHADAGGGEGSRPGALGFLSGFSAASTSETSWNGDADHDPWTDHDDTHATDPEDR